MRRRLGLLFYRVARWLAPDYFANRLQSINEIRARISVLRESYLRMTEKELNSWEGTGVVKELHSLESIYKSVESHGRVDYELVKVEIQRTDTISKAGLRRVMEGREDPALVLAEEQRLALLQAMAQALAKSPDLDKFLYFREYENFKTMGIRIYLKHVDHHRAVGNYADKYDK